MSFIDIVALAACAGHFSLFMLAARRVSRSPLGLPLALLAVDMFTWNLADLAQRSSGIRTWDYVDVTASSLLAPIALQFVARFVGRAVQLRRLMIVAYIWFGGIALICATALFNASARAIVDSPWRTYPVLVTATPAGLYAVYLLDRYRRHAVDEEESSRARLVLTAFAIGTFGAVTELFAEVGWSVTRLGAPLTLVATLLLAFVVLRSRLFGSELSTASSVAAVFVSLLVISAYIATFEWLQSSRGALLFATLVMAIIVTSIAVRATRRATTKNAQLMHHATVGRFSSQLAHDLRNPLAAMKGALQLMEPTDALPADTRDTLALLSKQVTRMERTIETYRRLGRIEPSFADISLREFVDDVASSQRRAAPDGVALSTKFDASAPTAIRIDRDLVAAALENVIRNAFEALPHGGVVEVRVGPHPDSHTHVAIDVVDNGVGIESALSDAVGEDFFTTKANGSGLGLSFARRVLRAHRGSLDIMSQIGRGTTVRFTFPRA